MAKTPIKSPPKAHAAPPREVDIEKLLTPEKRKEIAEKARIKIQARDIADAEELLLQQEMERLDKERHPEVFEEQRTIRLDLALYADRVILDGKVYFVGEEYTVPRSVYNVLLECASNTFRHEDEIKAGDTNDAFYRRQRQASTERRVSMRTGQVETQRVTF